MRPAGPVARAARVDAVALTADLVRCASVTPVDAGALGLCRAALEAAGFDCHDVPRGQTANLFARWGPKGHPRSFGFNGHTDVVPPGDPDAWSVDPYGAEIRDGRLWGRGATDMKSGVAAFIAAAAGFVRQTPPDGAVIVALTGDEEGPATDGTVALIDWMAAHGEAMSVCIVGEPTCRERFGDTIKIGRRGSLAARLTARGVQGHVAYPHRARNPVPALAALVARLSAARLDDGSAHFDPSTLAVTGIDTGNPATNVIPAACTATLNVRFNDTRPAEAVAAWLRGEAAAVSAAHAVEIDVETSVSAEAFLTAPGAFSDLVGAAVAAETGLRPALSTSGGTSDARFVKDHCPVVEFGLVGRSMHQVDEHVALAEIGALQAVYARILRDWFAVA